MRRAVLILALVLLAGSPRALAEEPGPERDALWNSAVFLDGTKLEPVFPDRTVPVVVAPPSAENRGLIARLVAYVPAQAQHLPGLGHDKGDEEMRAMVVAMGAMSGYMLAAMPLSLSGVVWAAAGGIAANYWYDNYR